MMVTVTRPDGEKVQVHTELVKSCLPLEKGQFFGWPASAILHYENGLFQAICETPEEYEKLTKGKQKPLLNYRVLLKKYMNIVIEAESVSFLDSYWSEGEVRALSQDELDELKLIEEEVLAARKEDGK